MSQDFHALAWLSRRTESGFGANMNAEEDDERTRNSMATRSRGAVELKPHNPLWFESKPEQ